MDFFARFLNGKLLFERVETRIMVGITMFVATMVLIGWVAINEGARMAAFDQQFNARAIERGAAMFATYCTTCHGNDGLGIAGRAPALNNPQLFGHDYLPEVNPERDALHAEKTQLQTELNNVVNPPTEERTTAINARITEIDTRVAELEQQALSFYSQAQGAMLRGYDIYKPNRLTNVSWGANSLYNYVYSTVLSGRPVSSAYFPQPMPNWAQLTGGSLRDDQIRDVVAFVLNWNRDFTVEDLLAVQQFGVEPCNPNSCTGTDVVTVNSIISSDGFDGLRTQLDEATGDPTHGQTLYTAQALTGTGAILGCAGCHVGVGTAPELTGTWTRVETERLPTLPAYADGVDYLIHSITRPAEYIVPTFTSVTMPTDLGDKLDVQDLADIIAYLESQDQ